MISERINQLLQSGSTKEQVYQQLLTEGYLLSEIEKNFSHATSKKKILSNPTFYSWLLAGFGAVLTGLGFISIVAANWEFIPDPLKLVLVSLVMMLFYLGAVIAQKRTNIIWLSNILYLVGGLVYGADIFLVSQIYNLPIQWQDGFLYWFIGVLFLALARNSYILAFTSVIIFYISSPLFFDPIYFGFSFAPQFSEAHSFFVLSAALVSVLLASYLYKQKTTESFRKLQNQFPLV